jgi:hypothetical protein
MNGQLSHVADELVSHDMPKASEGSKPPSPSNTLLGNHWLILGLTEKSGAESIEACALDSDSPSLIGPTDECPPSDLNAEKHAWNNNSKNKQRQENAFHIFKPDSMQNNTNGFGRLTRSTAKVVGCGSAEKPV